MTETPRFAAYAPDIEKPAPDEPAIARALAETMLSICHTTYSGSGHATRAVHAKAHGLLDAELAVLPDLPPAYAQGIFARPARHAAILRLSSAPGDILHDGVSTPRGLALKILNVVGERLEGGLPGSTSQDFLMVNGKQFTARTGREFLTSLEGLALTTDRLEGAKRALSAVLRGVEAGLEAVGSGSATLKALGGQPKTHPLGEAYYAQLPFRHGAHVARLAILPASDNLRALSDAGLPHPDDENALRQAMQAFFAEQTAVWHLAVQLATDFDRMPVEDPTAEWDEAESPFVPVAVLTARPQSAYDAEKRRAFDDGLSFRPWNGIADHRPLGQIMRLRRLAYDRSTAFRSERNDMPVREPGPGCPWHARG